MAEYIPPCVQASCEYNPGNPIITELCKGIGATMIEAGGASLLEINSCPLSALVELGPESDNPQIASLRRRVGITGYYEETAPEE